MAKECRLSQNRAREHMSQLLNSGFLTREKKGSKEYIYFPSEKKFEEINTDDIEFSKEELDQWIQEQTLKHPERLEVIYP